MTWIGQKVFPLTEIRALRTEFYMKNVVTVFLLRTDSLWDYNIQICTIQKTS